MESNMKLDENLTDQIFDMASFVLKTGSLNEFYLENRLRRDYFPKLSSSMISIYLNHLAKMGFLRHESDTYSLAE